MSLFASIDVGSNTLRLLIAGIEDNRIINVFSDRKITRLGNKVSVTGRLQDENIEASIAALKEFSARISEYGAIHVKAIATSALREALNSRSFIKKAFEDTGISVEVISGDREAGLTLKGILYSFCGSDCRILPPALIIDIGGGSTEWILYRDKHLVDMGSMPVGVIKLTHNFIKTDPVAVHDLDGLTAEIISVLDNLKIKIARHACRDMLFIGTAGTFTTIAAIDLGLETYSREKIHMHKLPLAGLRDMGQQLTALSLEERKKIVGLEPERADLIIPGILFTIKIMEYFGFNELTISDYGLLEGTLLDLKEGIGKGISEAEKP
jgi:exopolyphosphatase / guanosine-5'-triphosphate,3'-diphosphate pyrophosphatase